MEICFYSQNRTASGKGIASCFVPRGEQDHIHRKLFIRHCRSLSFVLCLLTSMVLSGCMTVSRDQSRKSAVQEHSRARPLMLPAWMTAPDARERRGVPVDLDMKIPERLRSFENRYALPPWMIYGTVRALGMQRMHVKGDVKSYNLDRDNHSSELPEEDGLIYFVPEKDIHAALTEIVRNCFKARDEDELNSRIASYTQCLYRERYALFTLQPSAEAFGRGSSHTLEVFKAGRDDLPVIGWITDDHFFETTVAADYDPARPLVSFQRAEELAIRDLAAGLSVKFQNIDTHASVQTKHYAATLTESAVKQSFSLELRGVQVVRRAVDVEQGICLVALRIPRSGIELR